MDEQPDGGVRPDLYYRRVKRVYPRKFDPYRVQVLKGADDQEYYLGYTEEVGEVHVLGALQNGEVRAYHRGDEWMLEFRWDAAASGDHEPENIEGFALLELDSLRIVQITELAPFLKVLKGMIRFMRSTRAHRFFDDEEKKMLPSFPAKINKLELMVEFLMKNARPVHAIRR